MTQIRAINKRAAQQTCWDLQRQNRVADYGYHSSPQGTRWFVYLYF